MAITREVAANQAFWFSTAFLFDLSVGVGIEVYARDQKPRYPLIADIGTSCSHPRVLVQELS